MGCNEVVGDHLYGLGEAEAAQVHCTHTHTHTRIYTHEIKILYVVENTKQTHVCCDGCGAVWTRVCVCVCVCVCRSPFLLMRPGRISAGSSLSG